MNESLKNKLWAIFAVVFLLVCGYMIIFDNFEHIEDTNGASTKINRITDQEIIDCKMESKGLKYSKSKTTLLGIESSMVCFSADQYTGVMELMHADYMVDPAFTLDIYNYKINAGNFELVLVSNNRIIGRISPGDEETFVADIKGDFTIVAVGESADFSFEMTYSYFNTFSHTLWE